MPKNKKYIYFFIFVAVYAVWNFIGCKLLWQFIFAEKTTEEVSEHPLEMNISLIDQSSKQITRFGKYDIEIEIRGSFDLTARVAYVDVYDSKFHFGFKGVNDRMKDIYNAVSPLDVSIITGASAAEGNWQKFKFSHEYRTFFWQYSYEDKPVANHGDFNNLHVLPATYAIRRGFDTLKAGDIIQLKGWLVDWRDTGEFASYPYKTAKEIGEIADFKLGGNISGLCYYVYVTELIIDGYVYK